MVPSANVYKYMLAITNNCSQNESRI